MCFFYPEAQRQCFIEYFEDLKLPKNQNFDKIFLELCNVRCMETEAKCQAEFETGVCISEADVYMAIDEANIQRVGITVCSTIGKLFEYFVLNKIRASVWVYKSITT